ARSHRLDGPSSTALVIGFDDLEAHSLTNLQHIIDVGDAVVGDLGNVQQTVAARQNLDNRAEVQKTQDGAFVFLTHFNVGSQFLDATLSFASLVEVGAGNGDAAVVADVDLRAGFFGQGADGCAALADHVADLFRVDLQSKHARCKLGQLGARTFDGLTHDVQNVQTAFTGLSQSNLHDFAGDALNLDVHLQRGNAVDSTCHLEVHVAEVVLVAKNVGQHGELATVFDQAHGHTRHVLCRRDTGVHQRQTATANRCHRGGTVGFRDFGHHTDGVLEIFCR